MRRIGHMVLLLPWLVLVPACTRKAPAPQGPEGMVWVPAGEFLMGTREDYKGDHDPDECPRRPVKITKDFWLARCETTNAQYTRFLEHIQKTGDHSLCHPTEPRGPDGKPVKDHTPNFWDDENLNQPDQPVVGVDWWDAYTYAALAGRRQALLKSRLPVNGEPAVSNEPVPPPPACSGPSRRTSGCCVRRLRS